MLMNKSSKQTYGMKQLCVKKNGVSTFRYRLIMSKVPEKASLGFDEYLKRGQGKEKGKVTPYYRIWSKS